MLSLSFLSACSDYGLGKISEDKDSGGTVDDSEGVISSGEAPDYPVELLVSDCVALDEDVCPDNVEEGGTDSFCSSWVSPRRTSLDNAVTMMVDDLNAGVTGIGVYTIYNDNVSTHESGPDVYGLDDSAAMALIPGSEDEIREAIAEWEATHVSLDDLNEFPRDAIVCRVSVSEFENGDVAAQFVQGHQDADASSNDIGDAVIANAVDAPGTGSVYLGVQPEFGPEEATDYQYLDDEATYDIERGMDEVTDASYAFLATAAYFAEADDSVTDQARYSTLKYYGIE